MNYRPQRGGLAESMALLREFTTRDELRKALLETHSEFELFNGKQSITVKIEPYSGADDRIGWTETFILTVDGIPLGFSDGKPVEEPEAYPLPHYTRLESCPANK